MKKTIISIIGIALMLLAITACRPNYVVVPPIFDKPSGEVQTGTPVSNVEEALAALQNGEDIRLEAPMTFSADQIKNIPTGRTIYGNGQKIAVEGEMVGDGSTQTPVWLPFDNVTIKDAKIDVSKATEMVTRAAADAYAIIINGDNVILDGVEIIGTTKDIAGINVFGANNVTLKDITIGYCEKAPINISSSTVTISGKITAKYSSWYADQNVVQVNGMGGVEKTASTVNFVNISGIDAVWVEAVAETYDAASGITDENFQKEGQTIINGLDSWTVRYSDQPSNPVKGWMYTAEEVNTYVLRDDAVEADLRAMLHLLLSLILQSL